jgi:release factor glutamine methyltransferase
MYAGGEGLDEYRRLAPEVGRLMAPGGLARLRLAMTKRTSVRELLVEQGLNPPPRLRPRRPPRAMLI